ncbi:APC family permease [Streptomyces sp. CAI-121]|uniref:APC family permease n=1 Tax=unclassified Streptomyces TaxID=2593676 RepID=UPI001587BA7D|nr:MULTISPECIES: APC family permease [unclassified Streptomyces]NUV66437.1 APC family permease [Streptomyces sp. CAI-121]NUW11881.1 APC family permease [Streptomyces sp. CAI-68]
MSHSFPASGPESPADTPTPGAHSLTTSRVVFLVIAAAAPLAAVVGTLPLALIRGDGIAMPAAYALAGLTLLCFCAAFAAMTRRVRNQGALYLLVARALGKPLGAASAYVATVGYIASAIGLPASFGYFTSVVFHEAGLPLPWWVLTAFAIGFVAFFGYRNVDLSAKILGVLMAGEFTVLIVLDVLTVGEHGTGAFPLHAFSPAELFGGSLGIAAMFAFTGFIGFESAALYGEESADPVRSIPRAAYCSVGIIAVFYVLTSLILIGGAGGTAAPDVAREHGGELVFVLAQQYGGELLYNLTAVLLCTSLLASHLALHNAGARYLFVLGRESFLPRALGGHHAKHLSPHVASLAVSALTILVITVLALAGADPYLVIGAALIGLGTLAVVSVQAVTALAALVFFWRRTDRHWFTGLVAPLLGFIGLGTGIALATGNYATLTGSNSAVVNAIPLTLVLVIGTGITVALRLRRRRPEVYATFAASELRRHTTGPAHMATETKPADDRAAPETEGAR